MANDISGLFGQTLNCDYDDGAAWEAVDALRRTGARDVFDMAAQWLRAPDALKRARAADVLAQLGVGAGRPHAFPKESCALLVKLLATETETRPIASAVVALGHIGEVNALPMIVKASDHDSAPVRHAAAFALGCFAREPSAQSCLIKLMRDRDEDVRSWAIFSLGAMSDIDTPDIRAVLAERLDDPFIDARIEAATALGRRRDPRALPALIACLEQTETPGAGIIDAAGVFLGLAQTPRDWTRDDVVRALRERQNNIVAFPAAAVEKPTPPQRLIMCVGPRCDAEGKGRQLLAEVEAACAEKFAAELRDGRLAVATRDCLRLCTRDPVVRLEPSGDVFSNPSCDELLRVVSDALAGG